MSKKDKAFVLFNQGMKPSDPTVKDLKLAAKTRYNYYQEWKKSGGSIGSEDEKGGHAKGQDSSLPTTTDIDNAQIIRFQPHVFNCTFTPIMYIARQAATEQWGWNPNIAFEDFIDTILYHFFKDRGITLQGYIVDEEVENT